MSVWLLLLFPSKAVSYRWQATTALYGCGTLRPSGVFQSSLRTGASSMRRRTQSDFTPPCLSSPGLNSPNFQALSCVSTFWEIERERERDREREKERESLCVCVCVWVFVFPYFIIPFLLNGRSGGADAVVRIYS